MNTEGQTPTTVQAQLPPKRRSSKRWCMILMACVAVALMGAGGWYGYGAYQRHQVAQREQKYKDVVATANTLNRQGKYKNTETIVKDYLATKPEPKYQTQPRYFMGLAYIGEKDYPNAKTTLEQVSDDPMLDPAQKKAVLSALLIIATEQHDTGKAEKYLVQILAHLDEASKKPENKQYGIYYYSEQNRYKAILDSLRKQKQ